MHNYPYTSFTTSLGLLYEDNVKQCHVERTLTAYTLTVQNLKTQQENTDIINCRGHRGRKLAPQKPVPSEDKVHNSSPSSH